MLKENIFAELAKIFLKLSASKGLQAAVRASKEDPTLSASLKNIRDRKTDGRDDMQQRRLDLICKHRPSSELCKKRKKPTEEKPSNFE
jgi:hypothetical protein